MAGADDFATTAEWLADRVLGQFRSLRQAAIKLEVDRGALAAYTNGEKIPPDAFVRRFARRFGDDERAMLALARRSRGDEPEIEPPRPADVDRRAVYEEAPPAWVRDMLAKMDEIAAGVLSIRMGHATLPTALSTPIADAREALAAAGHVGLTPIEAPNDVPPHVRAGILVWIDAALPVAPGAVVYVERGAEKLLGRVAPDGRSVFAPADGAPIALDDPAIRVLVPARLAQIPLP